MDEWMEVSVWRVGRSGEDRLMYRRSEEAEKYTRKRVKVIKDWHIRVGK